MTAELVPADLPGVLVPIGEDPDSEEFDALPDGVVETFVVSEIVIAGKPRPVKTVTQCATCRSPLRFSYIEYYLSRSYGPAAVRQMIVNEHPANQVPSVASIRRHMKRGHSAANAVMQAIQQKAAEDLGKQITDDITETLEQLAIARTVVDGVGREMLSGEREVSENIFKMMWEYVRDFERVNGNKDALGADLFDRVVERILSIGSDHARDRALYAHDLRSDPLLIAFDAMVHGQREDVPTDL